ncbi:MAG: PilN domain-containing protein [Deltaproteobacteria bacterium]|jgi:type IV pilus assembly protein PilN|nr:PilN domain-containing protein [Deltaproteobacteria bacterium]MBW2237910.1 PilN domain-containing protein [Deltaproteobacteria bacterium]MBW2572499.1 PilN domain-containing protein [Deltaproteobacteria bacterium]MBW2668942.1 PilN domain-containing protein [Deltaproteobacteria bacterium]
MIRINLLPYRAAQKKENIRRQISIFVLAVIMVVGTLVYYNISLNNDIDALNTQIKNTKSMLARLEKQAKKVDEIKKAFNTLKQKTDVIKNLETNRKIAVQLLDNMTTLVAEKVSASQSETSADSDSKPVKRLWFTNFQENKDKINLQGIALDNKTIADFMSRLEASNLFMNVNLKTIKQQKVNELNLKNFEIICTRISRNKLAKKK